ncbi:ATP-binding protein [Pseudomonas putida]|nr:ATP-binding protein [Pseudomonas putida]
MATLEKFRISSYLKDVIGRDLVTNEFVAIFELVKNSFDAGAKCVDIEFSPDKHSITIMDDGHGMSRDDIREKWLFVAYSEKAFVGAESYRDKIKPAGQFAGNKGIGRFACDTLGAELELYSMVEGGEISRLSIDWKKFEQDSQDEFQSIDVDLRRARSFPPFYNATIPKKSGTVLVVKSTRHDWDVDRIGRLRRDLAKLIDPFGTTTEVVVSTWLLDGSTERIDGVDGPVGPEFNT